MSSIISRISVYTHDNDLGNKVWNPAIRWTNKFAVFVVIEDGNGLQGLGECWCFDTAPDALVAFLRTEVIPQFIGAKLSEYERIVRQQIQRATLTARHGMLSSALSGIDIARCDLQAKSARLPLSQWLNPNASSSVFVYSSGGLYGENKSNADLAHEMMGMVAIGFDLVKMKIGALSIREDVARVQAVLDALPNNVNLIVDGVYSYTVDDALAVFQKIDSSRIIAFQSPTLASNIAGMAQLKKAGVPVMATEAEYRVEIHQQLVDNNSISFLQTAPIACGGVQRLKELDRTVAGTSIQLSLEVSSTAVAFLAACHIAAAYDTVAHVEYHCLHQVFFEQVALRFVSDSTGRLELPAEFGHGAILPIDQVQHEFSVGA